MLHFLYSIKPYHSYHYKIIITTNNKNIPVPSNWNSSPLGEVGGGLPLEHPIGSFPLGGIRRGLSLRTSNWNSSPLGEGGGGLIRRGLQL